ncbi:MAG: hypothetical protein ACYDBB_22400 [Armatimonadota bacterium]
MFTKTLYLVILLIGIAIPSVLYAAQLGAITLKEQLGFDFAPQVLHYSVEVKRGALREVAKVACKDADGTPILAQIKVMDRWEDGTIRHLQVTFISGLAKYETRRFILDDSGQGVKDDGKLKITTEGNNLVLTSPLVGVRIPALNQVYPGAGMSAKQVPPPIGQIRGKANWYGAGALDNMVNVKERKVAIADDGPITKKVAVEYTYMNGEKYVVEVTLNRGEELVRVVEDFTLTFTEPTNAEFAFNLALNLKPDRSVCKPIYKHGSSYGVGGLWDLAPYRGEMFPITYEQDDLYGGLVPGAVQHPGEWLHFACYNSAVDGDMVGIINTAPEKWDHMSYLSPDDSWKLVQNPHMFFTLKLVKNVPVTVGQNGSLTAHFPLTMGHREWAFFIGNGFPRTEEVLEGSGAAAVKKTYPSGPRAYFTQKTRDYFWNSLDRIKDYTLEWAPDKNLTYPRLYGSKAELEAQRVKYNTWQGKEALPPINDPAVQQRMKTALLGQVNQAMSSFMTNPGPPHHITAHVFPSANISDLLLGTGVLTPEEETRLKARLAYMAYIMNWGGYWAPEMGYAANPNMTSFCYDAVGLIGLLLADHPQSETWVRACTTEMDREFANWASEDGAWIESLHYVRAAWQEHTMLMATLKHLGVKDYYRHPQVQKFLKYYFAIQTPPDPEWNNQRGIAQIGNSYVFEPVDEFSCWAKGMADVDPELAGNLMWMWRQAGFGNENEVKGKAFPAYGAGFSMWWGGHMGVPGYQELALKDQTIQPIPPKPTNGQKFAGFGAVLNAHFGGPKETKLYLREGPFYSHWDSDQGSFVLWAKGAPLCMDHGYGEFLPWLHNRITVNHMNDGKLGNVTAFFAGQGAGLVQGEITLDGLSQTEYGGMKSWPMQPESLNGRKMSTDWTRRILFVKDDDPDGPNYLVTRDIIDGQLPTEWCLWVYGTVADFTATPVRATGKFGVDLLVYFLDQDKGTVGTANVEMPKDRRKQTLIHLKRPAGRGVFAVLFPTLTDRKAPVVAAFGDGAGAKIEAETRTDWIFLPEKRAILTADGVSFNGLAGCYSKRAATSYYMVERNSSLSTKELTVSANFPAELTVAQGKITGLVSSRDALPVVTLSGPLAARLVEIKYGAKTERITAKDGKVTLTFPLGETTFEISLK